jgi:predicted O-methyltransferase YrrM
MYKIKKFIRALLLILKNPYLLNKVLNDEEVNEKQVISKYNLPNGLPTVDILEILPNLNINLKPVSFSEGGSTPLDLALLKGIAQSIANCNYFEIGTWRGESAANVAAVSSNVTTLNLPDAEMEKIGLSKSYIKQHRFFSENISNITHLQGNSRAYNFNELHNNFDLIFIDGDHHYESVKSDTRNAFKLLKNENAIIVWHDYGNNPSDIRWDVLRGILDGTSPEKQKYLYRISNTLCAIYTTKKLKANFVMPFTQPDKYFSLQIMAKKL